MHENKSGKQGMPTALIIKLVAAKILIIGVAVTAVFYML